MNSNSEMDGEGRELEREGGREDNEQNQSAHVGKFCFFLLHHTLVKEKFEKIPRRSGRLLWI